MNEMPGGFAEPRPHGVGAMLAEARRAQSLELADIAARSRVPLRHLEAIERSDYAALPAATYSAGFVRAYAAIVGLDGATLARAFREEMGGGTVERQVPEPFEPADPTRLPSRFLGLVALVVAVLLAGSYALWRGQALGGDPDDRARLAAGTSGGVAPSVATANAPAATPRPGAAPATAGGPGKVLLTAVEPVWVRVYEARGSRLIEKNMTVGETYQVPAAAADPQILTGRPQALRVTVDQTEIPPLGPPERTIRDVSLNPQALLARLNTHVAPDAVAPPIANP